MAIFDRGQVHEPGPIWIRILGPYGHLERQASLARATDPGKGHDTKRFVTLTGVGGAGKTRLALEVAIRAQDAYPDGAWLVDLTPIKDGHLVASVFGSTLGLHERPRQPITETLLEYLRGRHSLLVIDNSEHVIE